MNLFLLADTGTKYIPFVLEGILGLSDVTENKSLWRMLFAEFIGTFMLVYIGCGSIVYKQNDVDIVRIALAFGIAVATLAQVCFSLRRLVPSFYLILT